jgi:Tol biopolymer transport system component
VGDIQFSPKGDWIAFADNAAWVPGVRIGRDVTLVDRSGKVRKIGSVPWEFRWSPRGDELWFNRIEGGTTEIHSLALSGGTRLLASFTGDFGLEDVARDGRVLLVKITQELEVVGHASGETGERNLSWLDGSVPADLSSDGKTLLFNETGQGGGFNHAVYLRRTDGSAAVRLGEGRSHALSPDGLWALVSPDSQADHLVLLPTGPGQPRNIPLPGIRLVGPGAKFFPDGKRILIRGTEPGHGPRLYALDIESGKARAFTPEGIPIESEIHVSPDGRRVVSSIDDEETVIYDVEGGPPQPVPAIPRTHYAIRWCADGRSLFVRTVTTAPLKVHRLDLATGRQEPWKEFSITDIGAGRAGVIPAPDGNSYVYSYTRHFSDLFIAEGLK